MDFLKKRASLLTFLLIIAIFCYFRLQPLQSQTVAYTYDQGRDFLKAAEIGAYRNPTFIGPTTGIAGLYHGAWYYYYLAIPFLFAGGLPIAFYNFHFLIYLGSLVFLFYFLNKHFGDRIALTISFLVAISPYFIGVSFFIGNNTVTPPFVLFFLALNYLIFQKKAENIGIFLFLTGFSLGMIAEFEFAFGLMLIPVYLLFTLVFKNLRIIYSKFTRALFFFLGLSIPFSLRLLFDLKNNFMQFKTLLSFIFKPKYYTPKPYDQILVDRLNLFWGYYKGMFDEPFLVYGFLAVVAAALLFIFKKKHYDSFLVFLFSLLVGLFVISTFYKDTFWVNYYEGIQYLFVFIIAVVLYRVQSVNKRIDLTLLSVALLVAGLIVFLNKSFNSPKKIEGLALHQQIINHIVENNRKPEYCVKIYTPPVIPYTYDYLFFYKDYRKIVKQPAKDWVDNSCWFIVERDDYAFRRDEWLKNNVPQDGKKSHEKKFATTEVFFYQK